MRATDGTTASSSTALWGLGMSGIVSLATGASSDMNASSATVATISAPNPPVRKSSCTTRQRRVRRTDARTASRSHGIRVRRSITSTLLPLAACTWVAASSARSTIAPHVTMVRSDPGIVTLARPNGST